MCEILTVSEKAALGVRNITKHKGSGYTSMQKMRCFLEIFTQLARILHDRWSRHSRQISTLPTAFEITITKSSYTDYHVCVFRGFLWPA